jgi:hypothetical protein
MRQPECPALPAPRGCGLIGAGSGEPLHAYVFGTLDVVRCLRLQLDRIGASRKHWRRHWQGRKVGVRGRGCTCLARTRGRAPGTFKDSRKANRAAEIKDGRVRACRWHLVLGHRSRYHQIERFDCSQGRRRPLDLRRRLAACILAGLYRPARNILDFRGWQPVDKPEHIIGAQTNSLTQSAARLRRPDPRRSDSFSHRTTSLHSGQVRCSTGTSHAL